MSPNQYIDLKAFLNVSGYADEIAWSETIKPVADPLAFWREFAWVVLNSGMKEQIARRIWNRVRPVVEDGASAFTVFKHKGKAAAIDYVWAERARLFNCYRACADDFKLDWLESLPWIGSITKYHLAKNYGHDCAKPDRHLVRISGTEGAHAMCARLSKATGDRIATVDLVVWRAANLGIV